jgi:hypothetical protein
MTVAIHAHRLAVARRALAAVRSAAIADGVDPDVLDLALRVAEASPERVMEDHQAIMETLARMSSPHIGIEEVEVVVRTREETGRERAARRRREGYFAAVLGQPCYAVGQDACGAEEWRAGWQAFQVDLAAYEERTGQALAQETRGLNR